LKVKNIEIIKVRGLCLYRKGGNANQAKQKGISESFHCLGLRYVWLKMFSQGLKKSGEAVLVINSCVVDPNASRFIAETAWAPNTVHSADISD